MRGCLAILVLLSLLAVATLGASQECQSGIVGFTALTPDQLREEINNSLRSAVAETFQMSASEVENLCCTTLANLSVTSEKYELTEEFKESIVSAVNTAVESSIASIVETIVTENMKSVTQNLTRTILEALSRVPSIEQPPSNTVCLPGLTSSSPARSCREIFEIDSSLPSGMFWISGQGEPAMQRYCDMTRTCGGVTGGWMQVASIDMTRSNDTCPAGFVELTRENDPKRTCVVNSNAPGCYSSLFPVNGVLYEHVCGKIIGYQDRTPNAFFPFHTNQELTINDVFIDGVILSHGTTPRQHIWSFVAGLDETGGHLSGCPCTNTESEETLAIPPFIGRDYFCDTASEESVRFVLYEDDPLWDGNGCGPLNSCCMFNNPPWFLKELPASSSDDIEMRMCRDAGSANENVPLEIIELYVR